MAASPPRVVVFGIDGATFDLMLPYARQGQLPNLAGLLERGAHGPLRSTIPPITPCAWTTMMTGTNPGRHGVFDFVTSIPGSYGRRVTSAADRRTRPVWLLANDSDLTAGVLNVPSTYPPDDLKGYMVAGMMGSPGYEPAVVRPTSLYQELNTAIGGFPMRPVHMSERGYSLAALDAQIANREAAFNYLLTNHPTDVFIGVVNYVDHLQHFFFTKPDLESEGRRVDDMLLYGYQAADRLLGQVLDKCGPETHVLIVSDHGAGPLRYFLNMDRLLVEAGLMQFRAGKQASGRNGLIYRLARATPHWLRDLLPRRMKWSASHVIRREFEAEVDWPNTKVFRRSTLASMTLNLEGREPQGVIPADQYDQALADVVARLKEVLATYPETEKCEFLRRDEVYHGEALELSPDLFMSNADIEISVTASPAPNAPMILTQEDMARYGVPKQFKYGSHRMDGVLIAAGPQVEAGTRLEGAQIADVTPTLLALAGAGIPADLDGRVLLGLEGRETSATASSAAGANSYSAAEEAEVEDRLRNLGYL